LQEILTTLIALALVECSAIDLQLQRIDKILEKSYMQRNLRDLELPQYSDSMIGKSKDSIDQMQSRASFDYIDADGDYSAEDHAAIFDCLYNL
jgi:hypothetical protein